MTVERLQVRLSGRAAAARAAAARALVGLAFLAAGHASLNPPAWARSRPEPIPAEHARFAPGRFILKLKPGIAARFAPAPSALAARLELPPGSRFEETAFARHARRHSRECADRHFHVLLPPGALLEPCLERLKHHSLVDYAEPDWRITPALIRPDDPSFTSQWHLENRSYLDGPVPADLRMPDAWSITQGSSNVIVAILDTGINRDLPEFAGRLLPGYDFVNDDPDPADDADHGTAIAAILAATGNNAAGIAGIDWHCRILPVKVLTADPDGYSSWLADGIDWAVDQGAKVINLSLAQDNRDSQTITRAITNAIARGVILVSITSNEGTGAILFPGNLPEMITVGASDSWDRRWISSNFGPEIDLVAPGVSITTLHNDGSLWPGATGTSASAPMAAGVVALLASVRPDLTQAEARTLLCAGADDQVGRPEEDMPGFDWYHGWGRLNAYNSLLLAQSRIRTVRQTANGGIHLAWFSPPNGASRQPYRLEYADALAGPWTAMAKTEVTYTPTEASWSSGAGPAPGRFYRLRVAVE